MRAIIIVMWSLVALATMPFACVAGFPWIVLWFMFLAIGIGLAGLFDAIGFQAVTEVCLEEQQAAARENAAVVMKNHQISPQTMNQMCDLLLAARVLIGGRVTVADIEWAYCVLRETK